MKGDKHTSRSRRATPRHAEERLEERFKRFAKTLPGVEVIDDLPLTREQERAKRADYFLARRRIVMELKTLEEDTAGKVEEILDRHRDRPDFPVIPGPVPISRVLKHLPDGREIGIEIEDSLSSSVDRDLRRANGQIRETKQAFNLPDAGGLLVLLNDHVETFSPGVVLPRLQRLLGKRLTAGGEFRFPEINAVWFIDVTHITRPVGQQRAVPLIVFENDLIPGKVWVSDFVQRELNRRWADFTGTPLVTPREDFRALEFTPMSREGRPRARHEGWAAAYKLNPYLRGLSPVPFMDYGEWVVRQLNRIFLRNSPARPGRSREELIRLWADFVEEVKHRGVDMRELMARVRAREGDWF